MLANESPDEDQDVKIYYFWPGQDLYVWIWLDPDVCIDLLKDVEAVRPSTNTDFDAGTCDRVHGLFCVLCLT